VRALTQDGSPPPRAVVLDLEGVNFIDSQGAEQLASILELVEGGGATLRLARIKPNVLAVLHADGFVDRLGADRIHGNVDRAVEAQLQA
jgi:sulfate permease, SulP family